MSVEDELFGIRMELKNQREVISGFKQVDAAQRGLTSSTTKAGVAAERTEKKTSMLSRTYSRLGTAAKYGLGFLGVSGVLALDRAVDASEDLAAATSGLTRNFGFNTNVASRWAAVMHGRSVEPKALTMAFGTLSSKMVEAGREGGTALTAFHQLGITQDEVQRGAKDFEWGLFRVAKALGEEEGGAKRSTAAKALLGKGFQTLTPLFSEGAEGLKEQLHWADKYGVTLSTTTKDGLMDMVVAGRESRVAMLGLQIAMTKAAMPAIKAGEEELHQFIATLNDPDLSADQKIRRIEKQFLRIEDTLIDIVTAALPRIAEHGGEIGVKLAGALWHGFANSDLLGKLFIGGWLFAKMGGGGMVASMGGAVGRKLAQSLGTRFLTTIGPYFAAEAGAESLGGVLERQLPGLKGRFGRFGRVLGIAMGAAAALALAAEIKFAIDHREDLFGLSLFATPELDAPSIEEEIMRLSEEGYTDVAIWGPGEIRATEPDGDRVREVERGGDWVEKPLGKGGSSGDGQRRRSSGDPSSKAPRRQLSGRPRGNSLPVVLHSHLHLDGRQIAEIVREHVIADEALA